VIFRFLVMKTSLYVCNLLCNNDSNHLIKIVVLFHPTYKKFEKGLVTN